MPDVTQRVVINYTITFTSPFHFGTGLGSGLVDRVVRRDDAGLLVAPGSTIKGVVREQCERLATWMGQPARSPHVEPTPRGAGSFGAPSTAGSPGAPPVWAATTGTPGLITRLFGDRGHPGTLFFDDATLAPDERAFFAPHGVHEQARFQAWQVEERTRVSMSRLLGTARPNHLFTSEYGQRALSFDGSIVGAITDWPLAALEPGAPGSFALLALVAGLLSVERLGGGCSSGAGACRTAVTALQVDGAQVDVREYLQHLELLDPEYYELAMTE